MKLPLIFIISFNLVAASILDQSVGTLQELNGDTEEIEVDPCTKASSQNTCERTSELDTAKLEKYLKCTNDNPYNQESFQQFLQEDKTS